jgi:hypothetical protein
VDIHLAFASTEAVGVDTASLATVDISPVVVVRIVPRDRVVSIGLATADTARVVIGTAQVVAGTGPEEVNRISIAVS